MNYGFGMNLMVCRTTGATSSVLYLHGKVSRQRGLWQLMYQFNLTDHLGNVRLTFEDTDSSGTISADLEVIQSNDPYPFGMSMAGMTYPVGSPKMIYLYNGMELQDELGLNIYDTEYRNLDPAIARWWQIDPKATERESPYVSMANNPCLLLILKEIHLTILLLKENCLVRSMMI
ncbi:MAG: hypothetical protein R3B93_16115 [Bacteroidia bacterium]